MNGKSNVLFIAPESLPVPPVKGGAVESVIYQAANYLKDRFSITVISPADSSLPLVHVEKEIEYRHIARMCSLRRDKVPLRLAKVPFIKLPRVFYKSPYINGVLEEIGNVKPDIVHVHNSPLYVLFIKQRFPNVKIILHMHNRHLVRMNRCLADDIVKNTDIIAGVSKYIVDDIAAAFPEAKLKLRVLYNGVDTDHFKPMPPDGIREELGVPTNSKILLFAGRLTKQKGVHVLLEALQGDLAEGWTLLLTGSSWFGETRKNRYLKKLEELSRNIKIPVVFTGFIEHKKMSDVLAVADLTVLPSIGEEAFPLIALESAAVGTPVLCNVIGGAAESILDGETGFLNYDISTKGLRIKIQAVLAEESIKLKAMRKSCRDHIIQHYSWDICSGVYSATYGELLSNCKVPQSSVSIGADLK
ncbi:MAG: glycosyltransferase family 4 protein [Negativicutes bacterium]|nr:glycosyltransferase family 4 protein [Negativicutes bacterium]